jgi:hypothetical protein
MAIADMPPSTLAQVVAAIGTIGTIIALLINALAAWRRSNRVEGKVDQVHVIVNQQRTDMQRYIRAQSALLREHGIALPIDQSIDPEEAR